MRTLLLIVLALDAGGAPSFSQLLSRYAVNGAVDYARWHASAEDTRALDADVAAMLKAPPPPEGRLGYWLDLYNALVIREVLARWPLDSVMDGGPAFFRAARFDVAGKSLSLDDIERKILDAGLHDARIHFALNCGAASCPLLDARSFDAKGLDERLQRATEQFIADPAHVRVSDERHRVELSQLFEWYQDQFVAYARRTEKGAGLLDFVAAFAQEPLASQLRRAKAQGYAIAFIPYDWSVNDANAGVGMRADDAPLPLIGADAGAFRPSDARGRVLVLSYFASWCEPCRRALPGLDALYRARGRDGLLVVGVSEDVDLDAARGFAAELKLSFPVAFQPEPAQGVSSLPTELVVDKKGVVRYRHVGAGAAADLAREVNALLAEPK